MKIKSKWMKKRYKNEELIHLEVGGAIYDCEVEQSISLLPRQQYIEHKRLSTASDCSPAKNHKELNHLPQTNYHPLTNTQQSSNNIHSPPSNVASKLYGVNATIIIFVFVLYCIKHPPSNLSSNHLLNHLLNHLPLNQPTKQETKPFNN